MHMTSIKFKIKIFSTWAFWTTSISFHFKMRIFNFGLKQKLDHYFDVEFHIDFDGDGFKAQKPIIDLLIGPN